MVGVYVDDLIITGPSQESITAFKHQMMKSFSMSDLGLLTYYLGIQVVQKERERQPYVRALMPRRSWSKLE
jgi:hypothetical protein